MEKSQDALIANGILKAHNFPAYLELRKKYDDGEHMVGLTQATGTGKTYITAQFIYDECFNTIHFVKEFDHVPAKPKKVLILSPTANLSRQTAKVLYNQLGPNLQHASMTATTYAELLYATPEDLAQQFDVIIVDEFHRLGAEKWGPAVQRLLDANTNAKILGLTATPIRYLDEARDMGEELFDGEVVQGPNIADAIKAGILPKPKYILGLYYEPVIGELESAIAKCKDTKKKADLEQLLAIAKRETVRMENLEQIIARNIKEAEESQGGGFVNGKYIAYCSDVNHSKEVIEQLPKLLSSTNQEVHIYTVNYKLGKNENDKQIEAFKNDNSDAIKVMVSINMFDEGYHIPGVKGVFCFANTTSPIKHFQRIGRAIDEGNRDSTPLIFDFVNNLSCLRAFGTTCCGGTSETDPDEYVSPFKDLPFYMDEKSLTIAEMLTKIEHLLPDRLTPEQWIELFEAYFKEHPNATSIPKGTPILGSKMRHLKEAFNNGQGTPSPNEQIIINWFISAKRQHLLKSEKNTNTPLSSGEWIKLFEAYFKEYPKATTISYNAPVVGNKMGDLKKAYNNGQGSPSGDVKIIIDWFINTGRKNFLLIDKEKRKFSNAWIGLFKAYFKEHPKATSIPKSTPVVGSKMGTIKQEYDNGKGTPSDDTQKIIDWFISTGRQNMLEKEDATSIHLSTEEWIKLFEAYFKEHPKATSIPKSHMLERKLQSIREEYNNVSGSPSADTQPIINWFTNSGRQDFLKIQDSTKKPLSSDEWIELFKAYFKTHPDATTITKRTPIIGLKLSSLRTAYNNGKGKPSADAQKIIDWFISTKRQLFLKKEDAANIQRSPKQWIELFEAYFNDHPKATSIPYKTPNIGSKITVLRQEYDNGNRTPSPDTKIIIDWFINTGRKNFLLLDKKNKKGSVVHGGDDQILS